MLDFFLTLDKHVYDLIQQFGPWTYAILFAIIFAETGLVICPFLPGDSLLFAIGIFSHPEQGGLNVWFLIFLLSSAANLGDLTNYHIGKAIGPRLFSKEKSKFFRKENLNKTHAFFEKHGWKAIILARYVPIVRTLTPFVAGMGAMSFRKFFGISVLAAYLWVGTCVGLGHIFGQQEIVKKNFGVAALAIVAVTILPIANEMIKNKRKKRVQPAD